MPESNEIFTQAQRELLTLALNQIIPAEGQFPGAGDLGLAESVEQAVAGNIQLRRLFTQGLAQIEIAASQLWGQEFKELSDPARTSALREVETSHPAFFEALVRQCYNGYYTSPQIFQLIGYHRIPPQEYKHRPFDESLLEPQRQRAPFWRQV